LTDRVTAGANAQVAADTQVGGGEVVFSTPAGIFDLDSAVSQNKTIGAGTAERLQYHYYAPRESRLAEGQFTLVAQIQSADYTPVSVFTVPVELGMLLSYQAQYSQRFGEHWFGGLAYSQQFADSVSQLETCSLTAGFHAGRFYVDATLDHNSGKASRGEWTAFFSLRIELERGQNVFSTYDTHGRASRTEWQYTPPDSVESVSGTAGLQATPGQQDYYGNLNYTGRRAELSFYQDALSTGDQRSSLRWGTALVYADGVFAVTRPVQDSFAIFESTGTLKTDGGVGVQPQAHRYEAQEDWLGPAVLPQVTAYYPTRVRVEPRRAEADFDPQDGDILIQPTYRSGTLSRSGHAPTLDATVKLLWSDGQPAGCLDAFLVAEDGSRTEFVSNRQGAAYLSGLQAGNYQVTVSGYPDVAISIKVPPTTARQIDLGEIKLPVKP
jgi:outer membrane usher protein